jgi:hypothetical protein
MESIIWKINGCLLGVLRDHPDLILSICELFVYFCSDIQERSWGTRSESGSVDPAVRSGGGVPREAGTSAQRGCERSEQPIELIFVCGQRMRIRNSFYDMRDHKTHLKYHSVEGFEHNYMSHCLHMCDGIFLLIEGHSMNKICGSFMRKLDIINWCVLFDNVDLYISWIHILPGYVIPIVELQLFGSTSADLCKDLVYRLNGMRSNWLIFLC